MSENKEELAVEFMPDNYPFAPEGDGQLRCFVLECMGNADLHPDTLIENMERIIAWVKGGAVIEKPFKLRAIHPNGLEDNA